MAKKSRRLRTPNLPDEAFNAPTATETSLAQTLSDSGATAGVAALGRKVINWQSEYGEVLGDLRKTAIIAAAMITVMVVLSFVIR